MLLSFCYSSQQTSSEKPRDFGIFAPESLRIRRFAASWADPATGMPSAAGIGYELDDPRSTASGCRSRARPTGPVRYSAIATITTMAIAMATWETV